MSRATTIQAIETKINNRHAMVSAGSVTNSWTGCKAASEYRGISPP